MKQQRWIQRLTGVLLVGALTGCTGPANQAANHISNAAGYTLNAIGGDVPPSAHRQAPVNTQTFPTMRSSIQVDDNTHSVQMRLSEMPHTTQVRANPNSAPTLSVPLGWHVYVTLANTTATIPHSAMVVQYNHGLDARQMARYVTGKGLTGQNQTFLFKARTPGEYAVVCALPGHHEGVLGLIRVVADRDKPSLTM